ncbi:hypothetical protein [Thermodesulfobacterium hydrogeniphilum]|uniref:hypothetical protein n=1 Tax=Thermodesulfobacterium hydrogeniphilum TaxID=161156 RepID=UPI00056EF6F4|nr:hypothetical protein [Thermodesulfobacterium hydrogeniphilum]
MEEDIKKDLKEIKKDIEKSEEQTEESKNQEEADISPEKAEILIEDLKEEIQKEEKVKETQVESEEEPLKFNFKKILLLTGIFIIIIFCILGIFIAFNLIKGKKTERKEKISYKKREEIYLNTTSTNKNSIITPLSKSKVSTKLTISKNVKKEIPQLFKFELKNFLIPLSSKIFLDTDVILYFDKNATMKEIMANEIIYRNIIYSYLRNTPPIAWVNLKQRKELEKKLQKIFEIKKIEPLPKKIEVNGIILKG